MTIENRNQHYLKRHSVVDTYRYDHKKSKSTLFKKALCCTSPGNAGRRIGKLFVEGR